jgi:hypothetical protein
MQSVAEQTGAVFHLAAFGGLLAELTVPSTFWALMRASDQ